MKKIILRIFIILATCVLMPVVLIEIPFYTIRWIIIGKSFPIAPLWMSFLFYFIDTNKI